MLLHISFWKWDTQARVRVYHSRKNTSSLYFSVSSVHRPKRHSISYSLREKLKLRMHIHPTEKHPSQPMCPHRSTQPKIKDPVAFYVILHQCYLAYSTTQQNILTHAQSPWTPTVYTYDPRFRITSMLIKGRGLNSAQMLVRLPRVMGNTMLVSYHWGKWIQIYKVDCKMAVLSGQGTYSVWWYKKMTRKWQVW